MKNVLIFNSFTEAKFLSGFVVLNFKLEMYNRVLVLVKNHIGFRIKKISLSNFVLTSMFVCVHVMVSV